MNHLQTIKSMDGKLEYVLLPIAVYKVLRQEISKQLNRSQEDEDYEVFDPADYINNPIALARIQAGLTQEELARVVGCHTSLYKQS